MFILAMLSDHEYVIYKPLPNKWVVTIDISIFKPTTEGVGIGMVLLVSPSWYIQLVGYDDH